MGPSKKKKHVVRAKAKSGGKKKSRKSPIDVKKLSAQLEKMKAKMREMMEADGMEITESDVKSAKDFAEEMQEINRGLRESIKKAVMADGKLKPGQELRVRDRIVKLKPRPGCPEGSLDPEHYDLVYEIIQ